MFARIAVAASKNGQYGPAVSGATGFQRTINPPQRGGCISLTQKKISPPILIKSKTSRPRNAEPFEV